MVTINTIIDSAASPDQLFTGLFYFVARSLYSIWLSDIVSSIFLEMPMTQLHQFLVTMVEADTICHSTAQPQFIQRQINLPAYAKQAEKAWFCIFIQKTTRQAVVCKRKILAIIWPTCSSLDTKWLAYQEIVSKAMKNLSPTNRLILHWWVIPMNSFANILASLPKKNCTAKSALAWYVQR